MNCIKIHGIRLYSFHGCLDEESKIGGNYIVNVDIYCDFKPSVKKDDLSKTINYVRINEIVVSEMKNKKKLIESVAYMIINKIKSDFKIVLTCKVEIIKINPPINGKVDYVSVVVEE